MKRYINHWFKVLIRYPVEAMGAYLCVFIFRSLPVEKASALGGWLTRTLAPISDAQSTAHRNLSQAYPQNTRAQNGDIIRQVWDNFGRVMGEYPHLVKIDIYNDPRFEIVGAEYIDQLRDDGKPGIIFGAHMASWEVAIMGMAQRGLKVTQMYRATNNPYVDKLVRSVQEGIGKEVLNKGSNDARRILELLNHGEHLFMLVDQKMNRGIPIPFFGQDAMTAPAGARMAIKYNCPFLPVRVERLGGFKFRVTYYPPLEVNQTGDLTKDLHDTLCRMNNMIEDWVRARPEQWLWIHKRWPKEKDLHKSS
jgi:KDO2-lipid IV(A) lauroyltransferase